MVDTRQLGRGAERQVGRYLVGQGWQIIEYNFRSGRNEIDLVAYDGRFMVFVEVKARRSLDYGPPESFLNAAQAHRLHQAADDWLQRSGWQGPIRFDVLTTEGENFQRIWHFKDAL